MENEKKLENMSIDELATMLIDHPEMSNEIFLEMASTERDMDDLYKAVKDNMLPDGTITDDNDWEYNMAVKKALEEIADYSGYQSIEDYEYGEEEREDRKNHYENIRVIQDTLSDKMSYGDTPNMLREYCEREGYTLEDFYDTDLLKEQYKHYGYEYNPEDDTITEINKGKKEISFDDLKAADDKLEDIFAENPEWDDRPDSQISDGMTQEEYFEAMGVSINEFGEIIRSETEVEYDEDFLDSSDKKQVEFFLQKYQTQKETLETELKETQLKINEMESEMHRTGSSELEPEYQEIFELYDKIGKLEDGIAEAKKSISFYESVIELHKKEDELSALEAEEKTISEAEALIDKQAEKSGEQK